MKQLDLFYIPHPEVRERDRRMLDELDELMSSGKTKHVPTKWHHLYMMSKYFNFYFLPEEENKVSNVDHPIIYHIPDGTRSEIHSSVKSILEEYRGEVPIVMRSYDPHPPEKLSTDFMKNWHDLSMTWLKSHTSQEGVRFGKWGYDNHLFGMYSPGTNKNRLTCMIHSNRTAPRHNRAVEEYQKHNVNLKKTHDFRRKIAEHPMLDVFGGGWPPDLNGYRGQPQPFDQKYTTLKKYKFNVITLPAVAKDYIDEKILDSFLTLTIPVVLGPNTLNDHFPKNTFININDFSDTNTLFEHLSNISDKEYKNHVESIRESRTQIFKDFSTRRNQANIIYDWYREHYSSNKEIGFDADNIDNKIKNLDLQHSSDTLAEIKRSVRLVYKKAQYKFKL
jgi:hypothetical protein